MKSYNKEGLVCDVLNKEIGDDVGNQALNEKIYIENIVFYDL